MKTLILALIAVSLSGCASLQYAGSADYEVKPFMDSQNNILCCAVTIHNGKEIANLEAHIVKTGNDYTVDLKEQGVQAFAGQKIASDAAKLYAEDAAKIGTAIILAPIAPAALGAIGAVAGSGALGAAAAGGVAVIGVQKLTAPAQVKP